MQTLLSVCPLPVHWLLLLLQGEDVKSLLKAAMGRTGGSVRVVPVSGSEVTGSVVPLMGGMAMVNALLQQNPWSVAPQPQSTFESYDDGLEGILRMLKELGLEDYCDRFLKERVSGGGRGVCGVWIVSGGGRGVCGVWQVSGGGRGVCGVWIVSGGGRGVCGVWIVSGRGRGVCGV